jgi:hypothetical protein
VGIEVQLRSENDEILDEVGDPQMVLASATRNRFSGTRLLKYLVPWGDAIFNQAQADDLATDISNVKAANPGTPLFEILAAVELLVDRLREEVHVYLWFVGD